MNDPRLRIEHLRVQNYRVLRDVTFNDLTPLTVLCGANGSGKSTVFDVFAFLHEAFTRGLRPAWDDRNRIDAIRSRGHHGPVSFEIKYKAANLEGIRRLVTYQVSIDQEGTVPIVVSETLRWSTAPAQGRPRAASRPGGVLSRIAVEELEAWFLGDVAAVATAYPGVPPTLAEHMDIENNESRSFQVFRDGLRFLVEERADAQA